MWMGKQMAAAAKLRQEESAGAEMGITTIGGDTVAVLSRGEERSLPLYGPGGIVWRPRAGDTVLVIKGGSGRSEHCVTGAETGDGPAGMEPGELYLHSGGASVWLRNNGRIELWGELYVNGSAYEKKEEADGTVAE